MTLRTAGFRFSANGGSELICEKKITYDGSRNLVGAFDLAVGSVQPDSSLISLDGTNC
jgi:hypothetical protein